MNEQKKAEWLDDSTKLSTFKCSNCGKEPMYTRSKTSTKAWSCLTPYCPYCGAKMEYDGEDL